MDSRYNSFQNWLNTILSVDLPEKVEAINFNLYEDVGNVWSIELVGAGSFDEEDEDWACDEVFTTRDDPFTIRYKGSWEEVEDIFTGYIRQYLENGKLAERLKWYKAVAVGFVDGNITVLYKSDEIGALRTSQQLQSQHTQPKKFYKLSFDAKLYERIIRKKENVITVYETNIDEIECEGFRKTRFHTCPLVDVDFIEWPEVIFYFDSNKADYGLDYLYNVYDWPVIHKRVMNRLVEIGVSGIKYYPIKLLDKETGTINDDYVLMYIRNFIEAYDMEKSKYTYYEKFNLYTFLPHEIVLDREECSKYDIFRCNKFESIIYISQRIRDEIISNEWTGFAMNEVQ